MIRKGLNQMRKCKVASVATAVALALTAGQSAQAIEISGDSWNGSWDTTVSIGSSWRMEDRNTDTIGHTNLAELEGTPYSTRGAWSNNGDDGNLNFGKHRAFSQAVKLTTELGLQHNSGFGFFIRGSALYDHAINQGDERRKPISDTAIDEQGKDAVLLDAYLYQTWDFDNSTLQTRLGRQVVSWGESTYIQHGLSEINAVDVTKLRVPGSELKEGLIPVNTLWSSFDLSETLSLEAYVQFEWEPFRTDEPGTYFATQDFAGTNTDNTYIHLGFSGVSSTTGDPLVEGYPGSTAKRLSNRNAKDDGQFGVKLAWLAEDWNYTEFGFYYVNYHNKRPLISANAHAFIYPVEEHDNFLGVTGFFEYIENIQMLGFSFNTSTDGGFSVAGEMTYRKDEPLQIDDVEILFAALEPVGGVPVGTSQIPTGAGFGEEISGYRLFDTVQFQTTVTKFMGPTWGADQWVLLAEFGANYIKDMPEKDELRFNGPGSNRSGNVDRAAFEGYDGEEFFADDFSAGYRLVSKWDYTDVMFGWNMAPRIVLQHDVKGTTPGPINNFVEDRVAVTVGLGMDYQSKWKADIGYSSFSGAGTRNVMGDRDFFAANISYSF